MSDQDAGRRFLRQQVPLMEYFATEDHAAQVFAAVQHKMVGAMLKAENSKGRRTGAEHYICGVGDRISQLANKLMWEIKGLDSVYGLKSLPEEANALRPSERRRVVDSLHFEVVSAVLVSLRDKNHLYYLQGDGDWLFSDFICQEHNHAAREARLKWRDERSYHGRPSQQGRRREAQLRQGTALSGSYGRYATS